MLASQSLPAYPRLSLLYLLAVPRIHWSEENQVKPGNTRTSPEEGREAGLAYMQQTAILAPDWIYPRAHAGLPSLLVSRRETDQILLD